MHNRFCGCGLGVINVIQNFPLAKVFHHNNTCPVYFVCTLTVLEKSLPPCPSYTANKEVSLSKSGIMA